MRVKGAVDLKKRKTRSDKKRKYRKKGGVMIPYIPKRKRGDPLRVMFFEKKPMSFDGYKRWNKKIRPKIKKIVFYPVQIIEGKKPYLLLVNPEDMSNVEKIEQLAIDVIQYPGAFQLRMPTHSKNTHHVSFKKKADIKIIETEEGLKAKVSNFFNLSRYWFFKSK